MRLHRLAVFNYRNIKAASLGDLQDFNFFHGSNGSGKTSLLEAVHTLALTRSFRSRDVSSLISREADSLVVQAQCESDGDGGLFKLGVKRVERGPAVVRLDGEPVKSFASLASTLPVQLINSSSFLLLEGAPSVRRQFIDWLVFHVEHRGFLTQWQRYTKAVKQRNSLLRRGKLERASLSPWEVEMVSSGEVLSAARSKVFILLEKHFQVVYQRLMLGETGAPELQLSFYRGWPDENSLAEQVELGRDKDCAQRSTRYGPHRAEIKISCDGVIASTILSRGQIKTAVSALKIAQLELLQIHNVRPVMLIDDLPAELDAQHCEALFKEFARIGVQVFATAIMPAEIQDSWCGNRSIKRFHVEHGEFRDSDDI
ncbi:MAG: DNA replication/repair protein RecF [Spongiibacteraceae bacterium]